MTMHRAVLKRKGASGTTSAPARKNWQQYYGTFSASPIILFSLAGLALFLWAVAAVIEIRTSELLVLGEPVALEVPWGVFVQPYELLAGTEPIKTKLAWVYGWGLEAVELIFAFAFNHALSALRQTNERLSKFYLVASFVLIGLNGWANLNALPGINPTMQFLVALLVAVIVVTFPVIGLALIEKGLQELGD
jgi:hypothetical protein